MVDILQENMELIVRINNHEFTRYHFGYELWKPYLYPLRASNGLSLLADAPTDHRHHHGIWFGHGRVNEIDFWQERHNSGKIVQRTLEVSGSGSDTASISTSNEWIAPDGSHILNDTRNFTFYTTPPEARYFDVQISLEAPTSLPVTLHPTNEAGLPHIRPAEPLSVKGGGTLVNAEGKRSERETYKQRSNWIDCSGKLGRIECGIAIFNHPDNPEHPTSWFTRDYGPLSPNFGFFREDPLIITPDEPLQLAYRILIHIGNVTEGKVAEHWSNFERECRKLVMISPSRG